MTMDRYASQKLPDLTGKSALQASEALDDAGFVFHHQTAGGYQEYRHSDGSSVWIRKNGEVIRLGPKMKKGLGKGYHFRYDQQGNRTQLHSTGEMIVP